MANGLGDFDASAVIYGKFTTVQSTGAPTTLSGTPALSVYKDNSTTQSTSGVTLTADFDSVTGLNHFAIDTSSDGTFYSAGSFFDIVITTGTVNSVSAVGYCVGQFTIRKTSALKPTTAGRALDVSAGGEAGVDWANVGSQSTSVNLSATTISTSQAIASVSGAVGSVTGNVGGNVTGSVGSVAANGIAAASIATGAFTSAKFASGAFDAVWTVTTRELTSGANIQLPSNGLANITAWTVALTGNITGNLSGSVGSVTGNVGGNLVGTIGGLTAGAAATFFTVNSGQTAGGAVAGSVVGELAGEIGAVPTADENADALLNRDMSLGTDTGSATVRTPRQALYFLRNKWTIAANTLTVYKVDDTTQSWTGTVTATAGADPITANDPASA